MRASSARRTATRARLSGCIPGRSFEIKCGRIKDLQIRTISHAATPSWGAGSDSKARIGTQPEELLADIGSRLPSAIIPHCTAQIITTIENLAKHDIAKLCDGHHGRTFHLDCETTIFVSSARNFRN